LITPIEIGWAAGFIEGEGSFARRASAAARRKYGPITPRVDAVQKTQEPLIRLLRLFGGTIGQHNSRVIDERTGKRYTAHAYRWRVGGSRAVGVMLTLYPLLSQRRQKTIREVLADWKLNTNRPSVKVDDATVIEAVRRYRAGETLVALAAEYGVVRETIWHWAKRGVRKHGHGLQSAVA
jgi:hypothetical protein